MIPPPYSPGYYVEQNLLPANQFAVGLAAFIPFMGLVNTRLDAMLWGSFGLGPLQLDVQGQLAAALSASISWNPTAALQAHGQIGLALNGLMPSVSLQAQVIADLKIKIGGIQILIDLGLGLIAELPPLLAALNSFMTLPDAYYALYYGPPNQVRPMQEVCQLVGATSHVAFLMIAASTDLKTGVQALFKAG